MSESFGVWTLDSLIAVGGLAEVWRAHRDDTAVAIKRLHTHLVRNDDARGQFAVERELTTTLPHHPNVVHAVDSGEVAGRSYIALELVDGADVRRLAAALPHSRAVVCVAAACDGAAHLHAAGWVHGDINPGNLVIESAGDRVVLVDLGVSRRIDEGGTVRGTHAYMAPEQVRGERWTAATDVFALGVVLWELCAETRLFHRGPPWLSMAAVIEADVPPLADRRLDTIVQAALAKDPTKRLSSASELAAQLRAL